MPGRFRLALLLLVLASPAFAQQPQLPTGPVAVPGSPTAPPQTLPPNLLPNAKPQDAPQSRELVFPVPDPSVRTPMKERFTPIDTATLLLRPQDGNWILFAGTTPLREFGRSQPDADEARRVLRELRPTVWADIGYPRPIVGYGLSGGKASLTVPTPRRSEPVDLKTVRAEQVRGAWCLRDDAAVLLNFGRDKPDAEQAVAVCKKYGFNRIGLIGSPEPTFAFFYAAPVDTAGLTPTAASALAQAAREQTLTRTGVAVPGLGFVGERVVIDARQVEVRKDRTDYVLAHGPDVFAKFGPNEWAAQDALRVVKDGRFTEFCRVGELTFFLVNGKAPTRVPLSAQGTRFSPAALKVYEINGRWAVCDAARVFVSAASKEEAEQVARVIQAYQFDQLCRVGPSPRASLMFLAKTGGR